MEKPRTTQTTYWMDCVGAAYPVVVPVMGVSYYAAVIYGIPTLYKRTPHEVTRYNEVTGEPYRKTVNEHIHVFDLKDGTEIPVPDIASYDLHDIFRERFVHGADEGYVGACMHTVDPAYGESIEIDVEAIPALKATFEEMCRDFFPDIADQLIASGQLLLAGYGY